MISNNSQSVFQCLFCFLMFSPLPTVSPRTAITQTDHCSLICKARNAPKSIVRVFHASALALTSLQFSLGRMSVGRKAHSNHVKLFQRKRGCCSLNCTISTLRFLWRDLKPLISFQACVT